MTLIHHPTSHSGRTWGRDQWDLCISVTSVIPATTFSLWYQPPSKSDPCPTSLDHLSWLTGLHPRQQGQQTIRDGCGITFSSESDYCRHGLFSQSLHCSDWLSTQLHFGQHIFQNRIQQRHRPAQSAIHLHQIVGRQWTDLVAHKVRINGS